MRSLVVSLMFFCVFVFSNKGEAQIIFFPETNASWNYISVDASNPPPIVFNYTYTISGDTIVNGVHFVKIHDFQNSFLFRQDSIGRVYGRYADPMFWNCLDSNELLMYDFSLSLTDSVYIHSCYNDSVLCIVAADDSIATNRGFKRMITLETSNGLLNCNNGFTTIKWVEGIGSMNDLFYNFNFYQPGTICLQWYECVSLDSSGQNINFLTDDIKPIKRDKPEFLIDDQNVFHSSVPIKSVYAFNIMGIPAGGEAMSDKTFQAELSFLSDLPNGFYIFHILTEENRELEYKKIIVNK
jgi:hypothetical protein